MELTLAALAETRRAFDWVAPTYDRDSAANPIVAAMRARTLTALTSRVQRGASVLDLGCGPGADAVQLARLGYRITAIDWSPAMARETRARADARGLDVSVRVQTLGIQELERLGGERFDAAISNLGPFNCVPDLPSAARALARCLRPGAVLVASVIGRICPWELARYAVSGDWRRLRVRFARGFVPVPLEGRTVWTHYYLPGEFVRPFLAAGFRATSVSALSLFLPPPYLLGVYRRHPAVMRGLAWIETRAAAWPGLRLCGDHFLVALARR